MFILALWANGTELRGQIWYNILSCYSSRMLLASLLALRVPLPSYPLSLPPSKNRPKTSCKNFNYVCRTFQLSSRNSNLKEIVLFTALVKPLVIAIFTQHLDYIPLDDNIFLKMNFLLKDNFRSLH